MVGRLVRRWVVAVLVLVLVSSVVGLVGGSAQPVAAASGDACLAEVDRFTVDDVVKAKGLFGHHLWFFDYNVYGDPSDDDDLALKVVDLETHEATPIDFQPQGTAPDGRVWGYIETPGVAANGIVEADGTGLVQLSERYGWLFFYAADSAWATVGVFEANSSPIASFDLEGNKLWEVASWRGVERVRVDGSRANSTVSPLDVHGDRAFLQNETDGLTVYDLDGVLIGDVPAPPGGVASTNFFEANDAGLFMDQGPRGIQHYNASLQWTSVGPVLDTTLRDYADEDAVGAMVDFGDRVAGITSLGADTFVPFSFAGNGDVEIASEPLIGRALSVWGVGEYLHVTERGIAPSYTPSLAVYDRDMNLVRRSPGVSGEMSYDGGYKVYATASDAVVYSWTPQGQKIEAVSADGQLLGRVIQSVDDVFRDGDRVYAVHWPVADEMLVVVYDVSGCGWNGTFSDDDSSVFEADIEWMAAEGITKGCNPPSNDRFCPDSDVTRGQMAAFLRRAFDLPSSSTDFFTDDNDSVFEADINALAESGITKGCNPPASDRFCPDGRVTREQMAAFMKRAFDYPGSPTDFFVDDDDSIFEADINSIAEVGVTRGCNPSEGNTRYCPKGYVTRGQMAAFLHRAMG